MSETLWCNTIDRSIRIRKTAHTLCHAWLGCHWLCQCFCRTIARPEQPTEFEPACSQFSGIGTEVRTFGRKPSTNSALAKPVAPKLQHIPKFKLADPMIVP